MMGPGEYVLTDEAKNREFHQRLCDKLGVNIEHLDPMMGLRAEFTAGDPHVTLTWSGFAQMSYEEFAKVWNEVYGDE